MPKTKPFYAKNRRYRAQRSISRAWRSRKRRQSGGLVARTALSNRRQIKKINKSIETKMIETVSTLANQFSGQAFVRMEVDSHGEEGTGVQSLVLKPMRGLTAATIDGEWIKMKSLTYKIYFNATAGLLGETNHVGCIIVLDRNPVDDVHPNLTGVVPGVLDDGTLLGGNSQLPMLRYQNLATCGNTLRYKVLKHIRARVQSINSATIPPDKVVSGTLKLPYNIRYGTPADAIPNMPFRPINQELLFFFYSDSAAAPHPSVSIHCRFRYKDA